MAADLDAVGFTVAGVTDSRQLVQAAIKSAPDIVVCLENHPSDALFFSTSTLASTAPRPVVVFTTDPDAEKIARATQSGIHSYVINGYGLHRLRSVIHVAQARFSRDEVLRGELMDVSQRFEERKLVDRAKGILMRSHQISEDSAFRALRTAAMHSKQRVGQVAQQIIESAHYAEAVNRAGQLRMFSQRIVKLYALVCAGIRPIETRGLLSDSQESVSSTLSILKRTLSQATFGDLLEGVAKPWQQLSAMLKAPPIIGRLAEIDRLAEELLAQAEQFVLNLEIAGVAKSLHVINVAGRQRMLSQRLAKQALLGALLPPDQTVGMREASQLSHSEFTAALTYLNGVPLSTRETVALLKTADQNGGAFAAALANARTVPGQNDIADLSESLLGLFEQLTERYELSMQMLMK